jgi:hypothetical protein
LEIDSANQSIWTGPIVVGTLEALEWLLRKATGAPIGNSWSFQDPGETNAAVAVMMGWGFKDIFTNKLMKKECCGK